MAKLRIEKLPKCTGRTLIIGDIHGCLDELQSIIKQFHPKKNDRILTVGDMINRGPDSRGTIEFAREMGIRSVLGNHEKRLLKAWNEGDQSQLKRRSRRTFKALKKSDWEWISTWPHVFNIPSLKALVVHGGFLPGRKWKAQAPSDVTFVQVIDHKGHPFKRSQKMDARPWADSWSGKKHVFYGHTPRDHPILHARATGLDTGCVYGNSLTAVSLPDFTFYRIPAPRAYADD
jgi:predicted phosphodiesterase